MHGEYIYDYADFDTCDVDFIEAASEAERGWKSLLGSYRKNETRDSTPLEISVTPSDYVTPRHASLESSLARRGDIYISSG